MKDVIKCFALNAASIIGIGVGMGAVFMGFDALAKHAGKKEAKEEAKEEDVPKGYTTIHGAR